MRVVELPKHIAETYETDLTGGPLLDFGGNIGVIDMTNITAAQCDRIIRAGSRRIWKKKLAPKAATPRVEVTTSKPEKSGDGK